MFLFGHFPFLVHTHLPEALHPRYHPVWTLKMFVAMQKCYDEILSLSSLIKKIVQGNGKTLTKHLKALGMKLGIWSTVFALNFT